jgi:hypothetical protein
MTTLILKPYSTLEFERTEQVNYQILTYLLDNQDILAPFQTNESELKGSFYKKKCDLTTLLKKIHKKCDNFGNYSVTYKKAKTSSGYGRLFVDNGIGLQPMLKEIRNTLVYDIYEDLDFVNCHPIIFQQLCEMTKMKYDAIKHYNENRKKCIEEIIEKTNISSIEAKKIVLKILNGANPIELDLDWYKNLVTELNNNKSIIINTFTQYLIQVSKIDKANPHGRTIALILNDIENQCILALDEFLKINNFKPEVLIFDGLMVRKDEKLNEELLKKASDYVYNKTQFKLEIVSKEIIPLITNDIINSKKIEEIQDIEKNKQKELSDKINNDIQKCKYPLYKIKKEEFEKFNFKVKYPLSFVNIEKHTGNLNFYTDRQFFTLYLNEYCCCIDTDKNDIPFLNKKCIFIKKWFQDDNNKTFNKIEFNPPPLINPKNIYNSWNGFKIEIICPKQNIENYYEDLHIKKFLNHINLLLNNNKEAINYLIKHLSFIVKFPALKNRICLWLQGTYGDGKSTIFEILHNIIGSNYSFKCNDIERDITCRFSVATENKILNIFEEITDVGKKSKKVYNQLKDIITSTTSRIERKGFQPEERPDRRKYIGASNDRDFMPIDSPNERRHSILQTYRNAIDKGQEYFSDFYKDIVENPIALRKILQFLQSFDDNEIRHYNFERNMPISDIKIDMVYNNSSICWKFLLWWCQNFKNEFLAKNKDFENEEKFTSNFIYEKYRDFLQICDFQDTKYCNKLSFCKNFSNDIKKYKVNGISKPDIRQNHSFYIINKKDILIWLVSNKYLPEDALISECLFKK